MLLEMLMKQQPMRRQNSESNNGSRESTTEDLHRVLREHERRVVSRRMDAQRMSHYLLRLDRILRESLEEP
jgi:hypothetical protein